MDIYIKTWLQLAFPACYFSCSLSLSAPTPPNSQTSLGGMGQGSREWPLREAYLVRVACCTKAVKALLTGDLRLLDDYTGSGTH